MSTKTGEFAKLESIGRVAVLTIDNPPVNALNHEVRAALLRTVNAVANDPAIAALVIQCAGRTFFAGADIRELARPIEPPFLPDVIDAIESCPKPVVAAIHGTALGGGLEVAMGCHYRIAVPSTKLGLPEAKLGLLPGAGGTQRLPRLVGVPLALEMMTSGEPIDADQALSSGLLDAVVQGELKTSAVAFANARVDESVRPVRTRDRQDKLDAARRDPGLFDRFLASNARKLRGLEAQGAIVDVVRAGLNSSYEIAVVRERETFLRLRDGSQSKALRYIFFAERQAAKVADITADAEAVPINSIGVIGAGTMGSGIALALLQTDFAVTVIETSQVALDRGVAIISNVLDRNVASGRISQQRADHMRGRLRTTLSYDELGQADLIIEAAFENLEVKQDIFVRLDRIARKDAVLATNTSYLDVDAIASVTMRPESVVGLHFFSPANVMRLLEIVRGRHTSADVIATAIALAKRLGKMPVVARNAYGFIGNRMLAVQRREADRLILAGASPWDVDQAMVEFGMPMGPFQVSDLAGLDLGWTREGSTGSTIRELLCERDRRGRKTGAGFYDYNAKNEASHAAVTEQLIEELARKQGIARRSVTRAEILERLLYPMINEGAKVLEEGVALRASDIDVVWVHGYGWPARRGGPMFHADSIGLHNVLEGLEALNGEIADFSPAPLLKRLVKEGHNFQGCQV